MREPFVQDSDFCLYQGDCLEVLREMESDSVDCVVTSPPYWGLRNYGVEGQLGLESTPDEYVSRMVEVFREVRRILISHGTIWINLGDSYVSSDAAQVRDGKAIHDQILRPPTVQGLSAKNLVGIPWRIAFALQADGWWLRSDIIWEKPNAMPSSVTDRPTNSHEYIFLLTKKAQYYFDQDSVREPYTGPLARWGGEKVRDHQQWQSPRGLDRDRDLRPNPDGRNIRSVWSVPTENFSESHFAVMPQEIVRRCLLAGCPEGGTVLDMFGGSGTTALVARNHGRKSVLIELNEDYCAMAARRLSQLSLLTELS